MRRGLGTGQGDLDLSSLTLIQGKNLKTSFQWLFMPTGGPHGNLNTVYEVLLSMKI